MKKILFHREYLGFTGGHLKVWDYFQHFLAHPAFDPYFYLSPNSSDGEDNIWLKSDLAQRRVGAYEPCRYDALFAAGTDWRAIHSSTDRPVINLIQHVRHAEPHTELYGYLQRPALRVCVSDEVTQCLRRTQRVNGPCYTIDNGIDMTGFAASTPGAGNGIVIDGIKNPGMARELAGSLRVLGPAVRCITERLPRAAYLAALAQASIAVCLPAPSEGFYLPAIEASLLGCLTVCPRVPGNQVCFQGPLVQGGVYDLQASMEATSSWLALALEQHQARLNQAHTELRQYFSLARERRELYSVLAKEHFA
jgi:hypothetical protein